MLSLPLTGPRADLWVSPDSALSLVSWEEELALLLPPVVFRPQKSHTLSYLSPALLGAKGALPAFVTRSSVGPWDPRATVIPFIFCGNLWLLTVSLDRAVEALGLPRGLPSGLQASQLCPFLWCVPGLSGWP